MTEKLRKQLHDFHEEMMEKPRNILQIFEDFFGEDKVDMQGFPSIEELEDFLNNTTIGNLINNTDIMSSDTYNYSTEQQKQILSSAVQEGAFSSYLTSDEFLAELFFPYSKDKLKNRFYNKIFILVHFPNVRITNEYDRYVDIKHLWAKVGLNWKGRGLGYFTLNRSHYPISHLRSGYMHSHVSSIPFSNFQNFQTPCTGSGPIRDTMATLAVGFDESMWLLFCHELDRYVRVESVIGVPYNRLEEISSTSTALKLYTFQMSSLRGDFMISPAFTNEDCKDFIKCLIEENVLSFNYKNGSYGIGMSFTEFMITISNEFIKWYNNRYISGKNNANLEELKNYRVVKEGKLINNTIVFPLNGDTTRDYSEHVGKLVCRFKGKDILLEVENPLDNAEDSNSVIFLNEKIAESILYNILKIINYKYGRDSREGANTTTGSQERYI